MARRALDGGQTESTRDQDQADTMNGIELDRRMREILSSASRTTVLSSTAALVELGFGARQSFEIVEKCILAKEGTCQKSLTKRRRNS
jgi:hypothetical protein